MFPFESTPSESIIRIPINKKGAISALNRLQRVAPFSFYLVGIIYNALRQGRTFFFDCAPCFCKTVCLCSSMDLRSVFSLSLLFVCLAFSVFNSSCLSRVGKNLEKFFRLSVVRIGGKFFLRFFPKIPYGIFLLTFNPA